MTYLQQIINDSGMSINEIANVSGISSAYLHLMQKDGGMKLSRDKLIQLSLAIPLSLDQCDELFRSCGHAPLNEIDDNAYVIAATKRKILGTQGVYHGLTMQCSYVALETLSGNTIFVGPTLLDIFRPDTSSHERLSVIKNSLRQRRRNLVLNARSREIDEFTWVISDQSLQTYRRSVGDDCLYHQLQCVESASKEIPNFRIIFTEASCPWEFELKFQNPERETGNKAIILQTFPYIQPEIDATTQPPLVGFVCDNAALFSKFDHEYRRLVANAMLVEKPKSIMDKILQRQQ